MVPKNTKWKEVASLDIIQVRELYNHPSIHPISEIELNKTVPSSCYPYLSPPLVLEPGKKFSYTSFSTLTSSYLGTMHGSYRYISIYSCFLYSIISLPFSSLLFSFVPLIVSSISFHCIAFRMVNVDTKQEFDAKIAPFGLLPPKQGSNPYNKSKVTAL